MKTFVNLPVGDLGRSVEFFTELGFEFDRTFTDENATCMLISEDCYVMLLVSSFFGRFTRREVADATRSTEVIVALTADSRGEVDDLVDKALAAGGAAGTEPLDDGPMCSRNFHDPDGHLWEVFHMDSAAFEGG